MMVCQCSPTDCDVHRYINSGRWVTVKFEVNASVVTGDRSTNSRLASVWVGTTAGGALQIASTTSFGIQDLYFVTSVTLQNVADTALKQVGPSLRVCRHTSMEYQCGQTKEMCWGFLQVWDLAPKTVPALPKHNCRLSSESSSFYHQVDYYRLVDPDPEQARLSAVLLRESL